MKALRNANLSSQKASYLVQDWWTYSSIYVLNVWTRLFDKREQLSGIYQEMDLIISYSRMCSNILIFFPIYLSSQSLFLSVWECCPNWEPDLMSDLCPKQPSTCCYSISPVCIRIFAYVMHSKMYIYPPLHSHPFAPSIIQGQEAGCSLLCLDNALGAY